MIFTKVIAALSALTAVAAAQCAKPTVHVPTGPVPFPHTFTGTTEWPCTFVILYIDDQPVGYIGSNGGHNPGDVHIWDWADDIGYKGVLSVKVEASEVPFENTRFSDTVTIEVEE